MRSRPARAVAGAFLLAGTVVVLWTALNQPPVRRILEYGAPGKLGPTGRVAVVAGIEFIEISPGYNRMGDRGLYREAPPVRSDLLSVLLEPSRSARIPRWVSTPIRWVEYPNGFWLARREVSVAQFRATLPGHEIAVPEDMTSAADLSFDDADALCSRLAEDTGLPIRLPSEAEWECAVRAGESTADLLMTSVGSWGFTGLLGQSPEWCADTWHSDFLGAPDDSRAWTTAPAPGAPVVRVLRGGSFVPGWQGTPVSRLDGARRNPEVATNARLAFSLTPAEEHLVEPYLVNDE